MAEIVTIKADQGEVAAPDEAVEAFDEGARLYVTGDNAAALGHFDRALAIHGDFDAAHYLRGLVLLRLGRQDDAVAALQEAARTSRNVILRGYAEGKLAQILESRSPAT